MVPSGSLEVVPSTVIARKASVCPNEAVGARFTGPVTVTCCVNVVWPPLASVTVSATA
jgi:hypothetical protein